MQLTRTQMLLAYITSGFAFGSGGMTSFLVPFRLQELGTPLEFIGLIVGSGSLLSMFASIPLGAFADRIGSRRAYMVGTVLTGITSAGLALAPNFWVVAALQLLRGSAGSLPWIASQAYVTSLGTESQRAGIAGRFAFAVNLSSFVAPLVIGVSAEAVGYQHAFWVVVLMAAAYTFMGSALPDLFGGSGRGRRGGTGLQVGLSLLRMPGVQSVVILTFVRIWVSQAWSTYFPLFLASREFSPALIGTVVSGNNAVATATGLASSKVSRLLGPERGIAVVLALAALGAALSPHLAFVPLVYLPALLMGTGTGLSLPLMMEILGSETAPEQRGVAMGIRTGSNAGAGALSPVTAGLLLTSIGIELGFLVTAGVAWVLLGTALWLHARQGRHSNGMEPPGPVSI